MYSKYSETLHRVSAPYFKQETMENMFLLYSHTFCIANLFGIHVFLFVSDDEFDQRLNDMEEFMEVLRPGP